MPNVNDLILALLAPEWTPEFEELHEHMRQAKLAGDLATLELLLDRCTNLECIVCGEIACPHGEPLHFHHDGCPACWDEETFLNGCKGG